MKIEDLVKGCRVELVGYSKKNEITEGIIQEENNDIFFCSNCKEYDGKICTDKMRYKYSYYLVSTYIDADGERIFGGTPYRTFIKCLRKIQDCSKQDWDFEENRKVKRK